jgi:WD40 repeat protein
MNDPQELLARYQPKLVKTVNLDRQMTSLRYSPCGKILAAGGYDGTVRRFDATRDELPALAPLIGHRGWVTALAFHSDGRRLFSVDSWGKLLAWAYADAAAQPLWAVEQAHSGWIRGLAISPDGSTLATCGNDKQIRLWSADDGAKRQELSAGEDVFCLAFHPDGSLVSGDLRGVIKHWDIAAGKCQRELDARPMYLYDRIQDVGGVRTLAFDKQATTLVAGGSVPKSGGFVQGSPLIHWYDWMSGAPRHVLKHGTDSDGYVYDLHQHAAGFWMAATSGQPGSGKLLFHAPEAEQPFFVATNMANCHALAAHPDGYRLAVCATNGGSHGNGRLLTDNKEYPGNFSPLHVWDLPRPAAAANAASSGVAIAASSIL